MSKEQNEILEALGKATNDMREYVDLKIGEVRSNGHADPLTQESLDKANADIDELRSQLTTLQRPGLANASGSEDSSSESDAGSEEHRSAYDKYLRYGMGEIGRAKFSESEVRALSSASDADGAFLVPAGWESEIIMNAYDAAEVVPLVQSRPTGSSSVSFPKMGKVSVAWGTTNVSPTEQELNAGILRLDVESIQALVRIHNNTLDDSESDIFGELADGFDMALAEAEDDAIMVGSGAGEPEGILTNSTVAANATNSGVAAALSDANNNGIDAFIGAMYSVKKTYRRNGSWAMNSITEGVVRQLKDSNGQYLWQPPVQADKPATMLGKAVYNPEGMPDIAANSLPIVFGDFARGYKRRERAGLVIQRLVEKYAEYDQTGFLIKRRVGGRVSLAEAFSVVKISA